MAIESFITQWAENIDGLDADSLRPDTPLDSLPQWDSLAILTTLALLDAEYDVQTDGATLQRCKTIADIYALAVCRA